MLDQLTYTYVTGTNRLAAASGTGNATTVDTYNANGAITQVSKDVDGGHTTTFVLNERDLITSISDPQSGTGTYRYSASGHRYWKQVTGYTTDYYALDGAAVLGIFSGSTWQWNVVLPSGEVVGRQPYNGNRRYYPKDHLGSLWPPASMSSKS